MVAMNPPSRSAVLVGLPSVVLQRLFRKLFGYAERKRIRLHLMIVERELRGADTSHLSDELKGHRKRMLELLNEYWKKEEFPINTDHNIKTPQIRDRYGTPCAMAHLIERSGHGELVNLMTTQDNLVYIDDVKDGLYQLVGKVWSVKTRGCKNSARI